MRQLAPTVPSHSNALPTQRSQTKGTNLLTLLKRYAVPALLALTLTGCANLGAIKEFGALSADSAGYQALTEDFISSLERSKRHTLRKDEAQRAKLTEQSKAREALRGKLQLYHQTVSEYMNALASLAADEVTNYDGQIDPLVDSASQNGLIASDKAGLVKALANLLADAATNAYRQRELKQLITIGNAPLQGVIADMIRTMAPFDSAIEDDLAMYEAYYEELMHSAAKTEPVAAELLWAERGAILLGFEQRKQAIPPFIETLKTIGAAHQSLYDNRDKIADKEALAQLKKYTKVIRTTYKLARASSKSEQEKE
jgi:hypothetical protein